MHYINVIISRTDTLIGRLVRKITNAKYNHISIALDDNFNNIYSYTRLYSWSMFPAYLHFEPLNRLPKIAVAKVPINDDNFDDLMLYLSNLSRTLKIYNYPQIVLICFHKKFNVNGMHICSSFGAEVLNFSDNINLDKDVLLYTPMDVYHLVEDYIKFEGPLNDFLDIWKAAGNYT